MGELRFRNALVSVSNKSGLVEFVKPLAARGTRIVSTGGTAQLLRENGVNVTEVREQTGFPEVMDGRVRTLHPAIHMALLARDHVAADMGLLREHGLEPFDLVIGNLYPFERASSEELSERDLAEYIDIGGPCLLRAAAKNYERITVFCEPSDYAEFSARGEVTFSERKRLAAKVFAHVSSYDAMIATQLGEETEIEPFALGGEKIKSLRYGENPQQQAVWYRRRGKVSGWHQAETLQGKELSYNNLLDLDAAVAALRDCGPLIAPCCAVAVKHNNPCGIGLGEEPGAAVSGALSADPVSVFGGIVAVNFTVSAAVAEKLTELFLECVVAPEFDAEALSVFAKKKNLRVLRWTDVMTSDSELSVKAVSGGFLVQTADRFNRPQDWKVLGAEPQGWVRQAIDLSWAACAHLKSNAIAIASGEKTVGLGMGQVNRVDAVEQAIQRWQQHHSEVKDVVLASDAFFPFADSIEKIAASGIQWVVQPGGSVKDPQVIHRANELGVNLILTGRRHFKH